MQVTKTVEETRKQIKAWKKEGKTVGLVPTMGFLHEGHASLIKKCREQNDIVVVSDFVNPTQFGPTEDLEAYPRDFERDSKLCESLGILNLNACIAVAPKEDEYLTSASVDFHKHFGYKRVGEFHRCGYKFNRWYNMVWMEKMIGEHKSLQPEVKLFPEIQDKIGFERFSW